MSTSPASRLELVVEDRAPLSVRVSRQLRLAIIEGRITAGAEFPTEKELGEELGVGRSTIREALSILQAQGLLSGKHVVSTRRTRVADEPTLNAVAAQAIENAVLLGSVPLDALVELRVVIEGAAVRAAAKATPHHAALTLARTAIQEMRDAEGDIERFRPADLQFHGCLAEASGNPAFGLVMGVLRLAIGSYLGEALERATDRTATIERLTGEHEAILRSIERRQGSKADTLMTSHVFDFYHEQIE
jgi:GntR family transcriptional regulator, transcriptional repressor for pyruvate dehydrogenase complex